MNSKDHGQPTLKSIGAADILDIIKILENAGIACYLVGASALKYFGAWRVRDDWEICVPTDELDRASELFKTGAQARLYEPCSSGHIQPFSLLHTFARFKLKDAPLWFTIVPSEDCHLDFNPLNIEYSQTGLPYPKLEIFAQRLLDTYDEVALTDLIDGMNLTEEWGLQHLDLNGTNDIAWAQRKNQKIRSSVPLSETSCFLELPTSSFSPRKVWETLTRTKDSRIGPECPKCPESTFLTRFYPRNQGDPRLLPREDV